jgi:hypothetical protein
MPEPRMTHYRLHFYDAAGRIESVVTLACTDDAEAIATAEGHIGIAPMELWQGARKVRTFGAELKEG